jgi:hypothetical protein
VPLKIIRPAPPDKHLYDRKLVLVRPDQHIAWLGDRLTEAEAEAVLDAVLGRGLLDDAAPAGRAVTGTSA